MGKIFEDAGHGRLLNSTCASRHDTEIIELDDKKYASPQALARMLGVTPRTLLRWEDRRIGPPRIKVGNLRLYDLALLPEWLKQHESSRHSRTRKCR